MKCPRGKDGAEKQNKETEIAEKADRNGDVLLCGRGASGRKNGKWEDEARCVLQRVGLLCLWARVFFFKEWAEEFPNFS
jgi:hypothetical protein